MQPFRSISLHLACVPTIYIRNCVSSGVIRCRKKYNLPLRSAAPPLMIRATITAPVASSRLMVAPWSTNRRTRSVTEKSKGLSLCSPAGSCVLHSTLILHNPPEAPCSSPAWQSSPTLPPARPRSRPAAAAAPGQSSSEPQCRAPRERPDGTGNRRADITMQALSCWGAQRAAWRLLESVTSLRDSFTFWCQGR